MGLLHRIALALQSLMPNNLAINTSVYAKLYFTGSSKYTWGLRLIFHSPQLLFNFISSDSSIEFSMYDQCIASTSGWSEVSLTKFVVKLSLFAVQKKVKLLCHTKLKTVKLQFGLNSALDYIFFVISRCAIVFFYQLVSRGLINKMESYLLWYGCLLWKSIIKVYKYDTKLRPSLMSAWKDKWLE